MDGSQSRARKCVHPITADDGGVHPTDGGGGCRGLATDQSRPCTKACPIRCPTTDLFRDCSGHGRCMLTPDEGCSQQAICRCGESPFCHVRVRLPGWLIGWLVDWLVAQSVDWLIA